jgi:hypothetical protein
MINGKSISDSLVQVFVEEVPVEELTCQFIVDETSHCVSGVSNIDDDNSETRSSSIKKDISQEQVRQQQLMKKMMTDGRILDDSLLVDQNEVLLEIPVTPEKERALNDRRGESHRRASAEMDALQSSLEVVDDLPSPELQVGDHVYQWRSLVGIPWVFQHHGIVMDVIRADDVDVHDGDGKTNSEAIVKLVIADFSNVETNNQKKKIRSKPERRLLVQQQQTTSSGDGSRSKESLPSINQDTTGAQHDDTKTNHRNDTDKKSKRSSSSRLSLVQEGIMRTYTDTDKWHRVDYESNWWKRQVYRSGTCTKAKSDPVGLVLARVHFIIQNPHLLPDYHVVHANCECVAFWCKTGRWSTLQASTFLELTAAGQVKSSATLAAAAAGATQTVTVPGTRLKVTK